MNPLFIVFAQLLTGSIVSIVSLLLVAGVIGYITAWFYAKSVYIPIIKSSEAEAAELNRQISGLKDEVNHLNSTVESLNDKIGKLEKKIAEK